MIPQKFSVALHRVMAEPAGAKVSRELAGASHALSVSEPEAVTATILEAVASPHGPMYSPERTRPVRSLVDRRVNPAVAYEVAAAYLDASGRRDPLTAAAYARLVEESDRIFRRITSPDRADSVGVVFARCPTPYDDAHELIHSVSDDRVLEVTTAATDPDRRHPLMDSEEGGAYDRFRAVHDVLGHARLGLGFDRDGEFAVWLSQEQFHSPLARRALATELHGQHSVRWTTGEAAAPKAVLLDPELLSRTRAPGGALVATVVLPGR